MGRHVSPAPGPGSGPDSVAGSGRELFAWGLFTVPVTVVLLGVVGSTWTLALLVGGLELVAFVVVWLAVVTSRPARPPDHRPPDGPGHTP